jgi:hypothetical protein
MNADLSAQRALDRLARVGFDGLTDTERTLVTVWLFDARVTNGGFVSYFSSSAGDLAFYAPRALTDIGAVQMAEIAARANAAFGPAGPPRERQARGERVRSFSAAVKHEFDALETLFYGCADDLDGRLDDYLVNGPVITAGHSSD